MPFQSTCLYSESEDTALTSSCSTTRYILVLGVPTHVFEKLSNDVSLLEVTFRVQWQRTSALIKIGPSQPHEVTISCVSTELNRMFLLMRVSRLDATWGGASTYRPKQHTEKQADNCLLPLSRKLAPASWGCPTLAIECGLSESLPRLGFPCVFNLSGSKS